MAAKRIYLVHINGQIGHARLVRASNQASALRHVAQGLLVCSVAQQQQLVELLQAGVSVEDAKPPSPIRFWGDAGEAGEAA